jgi:phi LC3 family holin
MACEKQNRFKSKVTWLAAAAAFWVLIDALGIPTKIGITNETFNSVVSSIATILTLFGVLNNPTDSENF